MDYYEGEPTCHSCWIEFDHNDPFLLLCPRHAAADEMYEALTARQNFIRYIDGDDEWPGHWDFGLMSRYGKLVRAKEKHAIALADGSAP